MKSMFNLIAVFVNSINAGRMAGVMVLHKEGGVVVDFLRDIREDLKSSNLPDALKNIKDAEKKIYEMGDPDWAEDAEKEMKALAKYLKKLSPSSKDDDSKDDRTH